MNQPPAAANRRLLSALGVALLAAGIAAGWWRAQTGAVGGGVDFAVLHVMGVGIAHGTDVYALNDNVQARENVDGVIYPPGAMGLVVYPPATGFAMLPLAVLPFAPAKVFWFLIINATLVLGIRTLMRVAAPNAGPHLWMISAGVVLLSAAIRWGMMLLQGAPLVLGLLCFFVAALHRNRPYWALAIAALVTAFKVTLALPFVGLLVLHRRFGAVVVSGGTWLALNVLGFLRMGRGAFPTYQKSVAAFEAVGDATNINSPNPWTPVSLPRLDWVSLFYGVSGNHSLSRVASLACSALVAIWLLREGLRTPQPVRLSATSSFVAALVCLGSLAVYHHQYDLCLFFAPVVLALFGDGMVRKPSWALALVVPVVLMMLLFPIGTAEGIAQSILGLRGIGLVKLAFPVAVTMALLGSLVVLRRNMAELAESRAVLEVAPQAPRARSTR